MNNFNKPLGVLFENVIKVRPFLNELERRQIPFVRINVSQHQFNPAEVGTPFSLVVNVAGLSSSTRNNAQSIFHTANYLAHLERVGVPVINGALAHGIDNSKAKQLSLFAKLGLRFPKTRVVNHVSQVIPAALSLKFPIIFKSNTETDGEGVRKFDSYKSLEEAVSLNLISLGIDHVASIQEYLYAKDNHIIRVETLDGRFLYGVKAKEKSIRHGFSPKLQKTITGSKLELQPVDEVDFYVPPKEIIRDVERIIDEAKINAGAVEYLTDTLYDQTWFLGISTLSSFVETPNVSNEFNPQKWFVDYIELRLQREYHVAKLYA
jgi:hypothetical protein